MLNCPATSADIGGQYLPDFTWTCHPSLEFERDFLTHARELLQRDAEEEPQVDGEILQGEVHDALHRGGDLGGAEDYTATQDYTAYSQPRLFQVSQVQLSSIPNLRVFRISNLLVCRIVFFLLGPNPRGIVRPRSIPRGFGPKRKKTVRHTSRFEILNTRRFGMLKS